jgi:Zn-dependent protease with chaperone function
MDGEMSQLRISARAVARSTPMKFVVLAFSAVVFLGADTPVPVGLPSIDQIVNASPAVLLALGFVAFLRGTIVQGYLYLKSEARADAATAAAALSNQTAATAIGAIAKLSEDHQKEVEKISSDHSREVAELQAEMARLIPAGKGRVTT